MKADQAASLVEMTAAKCSTVKYDVDLAEEYIARQVIFTMLSFDHCVYWFLDKSLIATVLFWLLYFVADFHLLKCGPKRDCSSSSVTFSTIHLYTGCSYLQSASFPRWAFVQSCHWGRHPEGIWYHKELAACHTTTHWCLHNIYTVRTTSFQPLYFGKHSENQTQAHQYHTLHLSR